MILNSYNHEEAVNRDHFNDIYVAVGTLYSQTCRE